MPLISHQICCQHCGNLLKPPDVVTFAAALSALDKDEMLTPTSNSASLQQTHGHTAKAPVANNQAIKVASGVKPGIQRAIPAVVPSQSKVPARAAARFTPYISPAREPGAGTAVSGYPTGDVDFSGTWMPAAVELYAQLQAAAAAAVLPNSASQFGALGFPTPQNPMVSFVQRGTLLQQQQRAETEFLAGLNMLDTSQLLSHPANGSDRRLHSGDGASSNISIEESSFDNLFDGLLQSNWNNL
ncbi:hypothetical protein HDU83_005745 [Entophlyctis luteolus]|nr:hypothetical protein HDU83_005745 [Entophlyctis luteolus]